jgi:hypothetical protein
MAQGRGYPALAGLAPNENGSGVLRTTSRSR